MSRHTTREDAALRLSVQNLRRGVEAALRQHSAVGAELRSLLRMADDLAAGVEAKSAPATPIRGSGK